MTNKTEQGNKAQEPVKTEQGQPEANKIVGGDERLRTDLKHESRESADDSRRDEDGTAFTSKERRQFIRDEWKQEALPTPPQDAFEGYHLCWLSTTNNSDPIYKRIRMGYQLVKVEEIPGWQHYRVKEGEMEGCISCNEMILAKIPMDIYQEIMTHFHHDLPLEEEAMLRDNLTLNEKDSKGKPLGEVEGFEHLGRKVTRRPTFV